MAREGADVCHGQAEGCRRRASFLAMRLRFSSARICSSVSLRSSFVVWRSKRPASMISAAMSFFCFWMTCLHAACAGRL